jgi:hypothetical protein
LFNDPATPPDALPALGATWLTFRQQQKDFAGLYSAAERVAQAAPGNEKTAISYYWLALRAWKRGNAAQTTDYAQRMLLALGKDCVLYWKSNYQAAAYCLKAGLNLSQIPAYSSVSPKKLTEQLSSIQDDLAALPASI